MSEESISYIEACKFHPRVGKSYADTVIESKHLPLNICDECQSELNRYYEFRKKCQLNDKKLREHLRIAELLPQGCVQGHVTQETALEIFSPRDVSKERITDIITSDSTSFAQPSNELGKSCKKDSKTSEPKVDCEQHVGALVRAALPWDGASRPPQCHLQLTTRDGAVVTMCLEEEPCEESGSPLVIALPSVPPQPQSPPPAQRMTCQQCGKTFGSAGSLQRHCFMHTGEKPYLCPTCGKRFAQKEVMKRHQLVHLAKRPFACTECEKSFTQREALRAHAVTHLPPARRPLRLRSCPYCSKVFCHGSGLSRHLTTHSGRRYPCWHCARPFADKSSLRRHLRMRHGPPYVEPVRNTSATSKCEQNSGVLSPPDAIF